MGRINIPKPKKIFEFRDKITNLAQTSYYYVQFGGIPQLATNARLTQYLAARGIDQNYINEVGLLCSNAVLPTTQLATAEVNSNYMGITQTFAHRRQFQDVTLEFYVDKTYNSLRFFEHWMDFIAGGSHNDLLIQRYGELEAVNKDQAGDSYFIRMNYPDEYKSNGTSIIKFERDHDSVHSIVYNFYGMYPYNIASIPVSYGASELLKMSVSFKIDRYTVGKADSYAWVNDASNDRKPYILGEDPYFNLPVFLRDIGRSIIDGIKSL